MKSLFGRRFGFHFAKMRCLLYRYRPGHLCIRMWNKHIIMLPPQEILTFLASYRSMHICKCIRFLILFCKVAVTSVQQMWKGTTKSHMHHRDLKETIINQRILELDVGRELERTKNIKKYQDSRVGPGQKTENKETKQRFFEHVFFCFFLLLVFLFGLTQQCLISVSFVWGCGDDLCTLLTWLHWNPSIR